MKENRKAFLAAVGALTIALAACGDDAMELIGDAMVSVGDAFRDGGSSLLDAESVADAQPPSVTTMTANCVPVGYTITQTNDADPTDVTETSSTFYYAVFEVPGFEPTEQRADVLLCGFEWFGGASLPEVPCNERSGYTTDCEGEYPQQEPLDCIRITPEMEPGRLRAFCGNSNRTVSRDSTTESGTVRRTATLWLY